MGSLSNLYISQSYVSLIHLGSDSFITTQSVELQDGLGNGLGIFVNSLGDVIIEGEISASNIPSEIPSLGQFNAYTASTNIRLNNIESTTASLNSSVSQLNASSASQQISINNLNTTSASVNVSISNLNTTSASVNTSISNLNQSSASQQISIDSLNSKTGSYATTGSNTFIGNQTINGNVNITGSLTASGLIYPTTDNGVKSFMQTDGAGNLSLQYVKTVYETVRNTNSYPIVKGAPLFASGSTGDNANVFYADASDSTIMPAVYIAGEDLAPGATGLAIVGGLIEGVNTTGFPAGTIVYVAEGGGWSANRPSGSNSVVQVLGVVQKEGVGGQGVVINQLEAVLPNIQTGYLWVGNGNNQPIAVASSSLVTNVNTGSLMVTGSVNVNVLTFTKGDGSTFDLTVSASGSAPQGTISSSAQITALGFVSSSVTASSLITASFDNGTRNLTFTKGDNTTFAVNIPDVSGSAGTFVTTSSFNAYTQSNDQRVSSLEVNSASVNVSIDNLNLTTASLNVSIDNLNLTTASLLVQTANLELFSASALVSISNINQFTESANVRLSNLELSSASQQVSIDSLNAKTGSYAITGSNTFIGDQIINGKVYISSSQQQDLVVEGQLWVSSSATGGTTQPRITVSGSAGQSIINRNTISTRNTTNIAQLNPSAIFSNVIATADEIGFTVDAAAAGTPNWSTGPAIYVNDTLDTYPAAIGFQNKANYTDGRVTILKPLVVSGSADIQTTLTASLQTGYVWVGDANGRTTTVATSSFGGGSGAGFPFTGSAQITGSLGITGSLNGFVNALTIASNTASLDFNNGNFFTLQLVSGSITHLTAANIKAGQTINLLVKTDSGSAAATGSLTFSSTFKFAGGFDYTPTAITASQDLVSFVTFDTTQILAAQVKNLS
jgi:uncharacterized coiled-coil protein SlyX